MVANFHFSSRIILIIFLFISKIPNCRKFLHDSRNIVSATFFVFICSLTGWRGAKITQNEKLKYKINRWMNFKMNTIFVLRILNYIILTIQSLWVFLSRTNLHFVNRVTKVHKSISRSHLILKVAPMCYKAHVIEHSENQVQSLISQAGYSASCSQGISWECSWRGRKQLWKKLVPF